MQKVKVNAVVRKKPFTSDGKPDLVVLSLISGDKI